MRLALSAWVALVDDHPDLARMLEDLPAVISNQPRPMLRRLAKANLENARLRALMADCWAAREPNVWATCVPDRISRLRREAMVRRFEALVLLQAAKEAR